MNHEEATHWREKLIRMRAIAQGVANAGEDWMRRIRQRHSPCKNCPIARVACRIL